MISRRYLYIFNYSLIVLGFCIIARSSFAQDQPVETDSILVSQQEIPDQSEIMTDSLANKKFISGVEFVVDYGKLMTLWTSFESKYEAGLNLRLLERIILAGEFGYDELNPLKAYDNALYYTVKGPYARLGLDYYTSYDPKNFYYAGVRYGMSIFQDQGEFLIDSEYWENYEEGFGSTDITASWAEIVLGTETYLKLGKKNPENPRSKLLLGWKFRLRILMDFENRDEPRIYSIPGYGKTFDKSVPAINFYLKYRIGN